MVEAVFEVARKKVNLQKMHNKNIDQDNIYFSISKFNPLGTRNPMTEDVTEVAMKKTYLQRLN